MNGVTMANTPTQSPEEFVLSLTDEQKDAVLECLLREAVRVKGDKAVIAVDDRRGEPLGYFVPPAAAAAYFKVVPPPLSSEQQEDIRRAIATPNATLDMNQFLNELSQEDHART